MKLIPTKKQFKNWSLPAKMGCMAFVIGIVAIIIMAIIFFVQLRIGASKKGQKKTHDKLDTIEGKLSEAINSKKYTPLNSEKIARVSQLFVQLQNKYKNGIPKILLRTESPDKDARYKVLMELAQLLKSANINAKYVGVYWGLTSATEDIAIIGHPENGVFVEDFKNTLMSLFINAEYLTKLEEDSSKTSITVVLLGEPLFNEDGSVEFIKE